ncbi:MarR family winged helix-turn-helix transcriptional regulator [Streptoverticillium reticulum]|uniref:MarR family winged helix-turn-helix transcriptional regulator n=1 Tax=Streptoverticillium reticulum TaxID=1433415 RepID=UPI0039BFB280
MTTRTTEDLDVPALAAQPAAYWTWTTTQALLRHARNALARVDVTQPQWWTLVHIGGAEHGLTREELCVRSEDFPYGVGPDDMGHAVDSLLHRGWLVADGAGRLTLTAAGTEARARVKELMSQARSEVHDGITDEEYAAVLTVLQRMIRNVGG